MWYRMSFAVPCITCSLCKAASWMLLSKATHGQCVMQCVLFNCTAATVVLWPTHVAVGLAISLQPGYLCGQTQAQLRPGLFLAFGTTTNKAVDIEH